MPYLLEEKLLVLYNRACPLRNKPEKDQPITIKLDNNNKNKKILNKN
jgi:hypothetical protein